MAPTATYTATVFFRANNHSFYYRENVSRCPPPLIFFSTLIFSTRQNKWHDCIQMYFVISDDVLGYTIHILEESSKCIGYKKSLKSYLQIIFGTFFNLETQVCKVMHVCRMKYVHNTYTFALEKGLESV